VTSSRRPWSQCDDGIVVTVRLTPRGGRDTIDGETRLSDGRPVLKVRVRAVASGGEANAALSRLLAEVLGVPQRNVALASGAAARVKTLRITGDGPALVALLNTAVAGAQHNEA